MLSQPRKNWGFTVTDPLEPLSQRGSRIGHRVSTQISEGNVSNFNTFVAKHFNDFGICFQNRAVVQIVDNDPVAPTPSKIDLNRASPERISRSWNLLSVISRAIPKIPVTRPSRSCNGPLVVEYRPPVGGRILPALQTQPSTMVFWSSLLILLASSRGKIS